MLGAPRPLIALNCPDQHHLALEPTPSAPGAPFKLRPVRWSCPEFISNLAPEHQWDFPASSGLVPFPAAPRGVLVAPVTITLCPCSGTFQAFSLLRRHLWCWRHPQLLAWGEVQLLLLSASEVGEFYRFKVMTGIKGWAFFCNYQGRYT